MQVLQAALTLQFQRAVNAQVKPGTITLVAITAQRVMQAPLILNQHVRQSLEARDWQLAGYFLLRTGEFQTVDDTRCGHKPQMIVFPGSGVKAH
jgi:hypothetical protein